MNALPGIGGLTDRVELQRKMTTAEDEGGHAVVYAPAGSLWARVRALGVSQGLAAEARAAAASHSVVIRHRSGVMPGDRFVYRGRRLEVLSTEDMSGRRQYLACRCAERRTLG